MTRESNGSRVADRSYGRGQQVAFVHGCLGGDDRVTKGVVDGAWKKDWCCGVAAWCYEESLLGLIGQGSTFVHAVSSTGVEALVVLQALRWASTHGLRKVHILTDSMEVIHGLCCSMDVAIPVRNVLLDVLDLFYLLTM